MSRIGKLPIKLPPELNVVVDNRTITVQGPKGTLEYNMKKNITVTQVEDELRITLDKIDENTSKFYGLTRTLIDNMVQGVSKGYEKKLEINGVGFRANIANSAINFSLGYSHQITYELPEDIKAQIEGNIITISGIDKQKVGQVAADIRELRKPEPYQGKGIKYVDERIRRKAGKTTSK
jgi:large subunit ribosomal protein L6